MSLTGNLLDQIRARHYLEDVNEYILHGEGEIHEAPGKLSLVWTDPVWNLPRFLSIKPAGEAQILINGRRFPASEAGVQQGLRACIKDLA